MAGTLPKTAYMLMKGVGVVVDSPYLKAIAFHFGATISRDGTVTFNGEKQNPSYAIDDLGGGGFTREGALDDWIRNYMRKNLPSEYKIIRYLVDY